MVSRVEQMHLQTVHLLLMVRVTPRTNRVRQSSPVRVTPMPVTRIPSHVPQRKLAKVRQEPVMQITSHTHQTQSVRAMAAHAIRVTHHVQRSHPVSLEMLAVRCKAQIAAAFTMGTKLGVTAPVIPIQVNWVVSQNAAPAV